jgi:pyruvate ferredoxin oxidoreductase beta subunit
MSAVGFVYPQMAFGVNAIISSFPGTASMLSGVAAGARALGLKDYHTVGFAGDGGTADIGLQALSGAIDRNDKIIYICYDNEAYMNTGVQKSSLTPYGALTTTTPAGKNAKGTLTHKKSMFEIAAAHDIPYAATASIGAVSDLLKKVEKAKQVDGTSYIHIYAPCHVGWGFDSAKTVEISRKALSCGLWYLAEYENGEFTLNQNPKEFSPIEEYLNTQARFKHITEEELKIIKTARDKQWEKMRTKWTV